MKALFLSPKQISKSDDPLSRLPRDSAKLLNLMCDQKKHLVPRAEEEMRGQVKCSFKHQII